MTLRQLQNRFARRLSGRWVILVVPATLVVIAVILSVYGRAAHKTPTLHETFTYHCTGDQESLLCLDKQYQEKAEQKGIASAFADLKAAYPNDSNVRADCHQLAHVIGRAAAENAKSVDEAYAQGDSFCWSGYYHGVMEVIVSKVGAKNLDSAVPTICAHTAATKRYSFYHFNCVHGLGHGIMDVTKRDLFASLKVCNLLTDAWEQQSCYGGVFMENEMDEVDADHPTAYLKTDEPMYPCTAVDTVYKEQCYLMQTSHALRLAGENFATVFGECSGVEPEFVDTCYQSLGRDASGNSNSTIEPTKANCMLGQTTDAQSNCFIGAVKDFISYYHGDKQADALCQALDTSLQPTCETTKTQYYATF